MNIEQLLKEQMMNLRSGTADVKRANVLCNTVGKYCSYVRLKVEMCKAVGIKPEVKLLGVLGELPAETRRKGR